MAKHKKSHKKKSKRDASESESESSSSESSSSSSESSPSEAEDVKRAKNREKTMQRSRMWQTVGSDSDDEEEKKASPPPVSKPSRKRAHSESDDSDSEEEKRAKKKKKHKHKDDKKKRKSKKDSKKNKKKHKKGDKKDKKKKKTEQQPGAVDQNQFGKYGIIRESDFFRKQHDFEAWARDIKGISDFSGPRWEAMNLFKEFIEDFNTATLPHKKYYNYEQWEMDEWKKKQGKGSTEPAPRMTDEEQRRRELKEREEQRRQQQFAELMSTMDRGTVEAMRHQERMRTEMQLAYRAGDMKKARELEARLADDEDEETMKYKHKRGVAEKAYVEKRNAD